MSQCVGGNCTTSLDLWAATKVDISDLQMTDTNHPNLMPFSGTLLLLDEASDQPPHGAQGHQILVPKSVAEQRLNTLPGMAINYQADLTGHDPSKKVGVITQASIEGNKVKVKGLVWKKDFPDAASTFKKHRGRLGMSMELGDVYVRDKDEHVWNLEDFHFTGATVLLKNHAAYENTDLAASKCFVKALAASREARGIFRKGGKPVMAEKDNKKKENGQGSGQALVNAISAAVATGFDKFAKAQQEHNEKVAKALEGLSASNENLIKGLSQLAHGEIEAGAEEDDDVEETVEAGADETDATIAANMDPSMAADSSDASDASDVEAEGDDPTNYSSGDQGDDAEPGNLNKDASSLAKSKSKSGSTQMKPGGKTISKGIAASRSFVGNVAAAKVIRTLQAEKVAMAAENTKLRKRLGSVEASLERYADRVERKSISPEISALLEKNGYNVSEVLAAKQRFSVTEVDEILANSGILLEPTMRIALKNQLFQAGLMDQGQVIRTH